jgi:sortase A
MKKAFFLLITLSGLLFGVWFSSEHIIQKPLPLPTPAAVLRQTIHAPKILTIPKLAITAPIEFVGLDADGNMATPQNTNNVGWYKLGVAPGEKGNAVIAGHFDSETGPAVFYQLSQLAIGDEILLEDKKGTKHTFRVIRKEIYNSDQVPLAAIFGDADSAYLNLITCDGVFDKQTKNYSKRLVVYTKLIQHISLAE